MIFHDYENTLISVAENHSSMVAEDQEDDDDQGRLVPQLKIGADGSIIIEEER